MTLLEREERAAVVQREAGARRNDAGTESLVDALDQRRDVSFSVDRAEVHGVGADRRRQTCKRGRSDVGRSALEIDQARACFR